MNPIYALVDCNTFYASCERVFQPQLIGKPIVVLSNNDGCVISCSSEAKALGIPTGGPAYQLEPLFKQHGVAVFSSNYTLYGDMSSRVMQTLARFTPKMEIYSIDEAFLRLEGIARDLTEYGREIKNTVEQWTKIPVTIGIGTTKTLSKVAHEHAKREPKYEGVCDLSGSTEAEIDRVLETIPAEKVWGVGSRYSAMLEKQGITNALQFKQAPGPWVRKTMTVVGARTQRELQGVSCLGLEEVRPAKKMIFSSRSFGRPVTDLKDLSEAVADYVVKAVEKLHEQDSSAGLLQVYIATNPFKEGLQYSNSCTIKLHPPTASTPRLIQCAEQGLAKIFKPGFRYKRAAVGLMELCPSTQVQPDLFIAGEDTDRQRSFLQAVDKVNAKWGRNTLRYVAQGISRPWTMRREKLSPLYTTRWKDLPLVKAV